MNHYLHVFFECAWTASIIPLGHDPTYFAMLSFGGFAMFPAWILAVAGAIIGQIFNWWAGFLLHREATKRKPFGPRYERIQKLVHKYGIFVLLLCWAPMMNFAVVAAGFLGVRLKIALPLMLVGTALYYGSFLIS